MINLILNHKIIKLILLITIFVIILVLSSCENRTNPKSNNINVQNNITGKTITIPRFSQLSEYPNIKDTAKFIKELKSNFNIVVDEDEISRRGVNESITTYSKVKINGSDKNYFLVEYDYHEGCGVAFPWKHQVILKSNGELVKVLESTRFEFLTIHQNENPYLVCMVSSSFGNGGHEIYKITADTLENVYEGYYHYKTKTFDCHHDQKVFEPYELKIKVKDYNNDGYNDISFSGKKVYLIKFDKYGRYAGDLDYDYKEKKDKNFKKVPIKYIFYYNKQNGHFVAKEDYTDKEDFYKWKK